MLLIAAILMSFIAQATENKCNDIQLYRRAAMEQFTATVQTDPFKACLDQTVKTVRQMQESDLFEIRKTLNKITLERNGKPLPSSPEEIQQLFADGSAFRRVVNKMQAEGAAPPTVTDHKPQNMERWLVNGPLTNFSTPVSGKGVTELTGSIDAKQILGPALQELQSAVTSEQQKNPQYTLNDHLLKVAAGPIVQNSYSPNRTRLTPFVAKMILFELIRQYDETSSRSHLLDLVGRLELKAIHNQYYKARDVTPQELDYVTIHDGYILGASEQWIENLKNRSPVSKGLDCTTLVQSCLEKTTGQGWPSSDRGADQGGVFKVRFDTLHLGDMVAGNLAAVPADARGFLGEHFRVKRLTDEKQLVPGDYIYLKGHMAIFMGYEFDAKSGETSPITYEAIGGELREIGRFHRQFYTDNTCSTLSLTQTPTPLYIVDTDLARGVFRPEFETFAQGKPL